MKNQEIRIAQLELELEDSKAALKELQREFDIVESACDFWQEEAETLARRYVIGEKDNG